MRKIILAIAMCITMAFPASAMTQEETDLLATIIALEAKGEPQEGLQAVAEVVINRMESEDPYWPDSITGVLSQRGQFATWPYRNKPYALPGEEEYKAIEAVLQGERVLPEDYVFFARKKHGWMHDCVKIGHHWFGR